MDGFSVRNRLGEIGTDVAQIAFDISQIASDIVATPAHVLEIATYAAVMAVDVVAMIADAQEIAADAAGMEVYGDEMTGHTSEVLTYSTENAFTPMGYGSKSTLKPCFFASLGRNIQELSAQARTLARGEVERHYGATPIQSLQRTSAGSKTSFVACACLFGGSPKRHRIRWLMTR